MKYILVHTSYHILHHSYISSSFSYLSKTGSEVVFPDLFSSTSTCISLPRVMVCCFFRWITTFQMLHNLSWNIQDLFRISVNCISFSTSPSPAPLKKITVCFDNQFICLAFPSDTEILKGRALYYFMSVNNYGPCLC